MRVLVASVLVAAAHAAVAGAPEPGPTGVMPGFSISSSNDLFANGLGNQDDHRTAGLAVEATLGRWVLAVDGSMLTDRAEGTRSDSLTAVLGRQYGVRAPTAGWHIGGFAGLGVQFDRNLAGQDIQNAIHRQFGVAEVHVPYDRDQPPRLALAGSVAAGWLGAPFDAMSGWWGFQGVVSGTAVGGGETIVEVGPRLVLVGREGAAWIGPRLRLRGGNPPGTTAAATGEREDGLWIDTGSFIMPFRSGDGLAGWQLRLGINPESRAASGSIGVVVRPGVGPTGKTLDIEHDLAVYNGGGLGVQLRWFPWAYQDARRSALVVDYRFGTEPGSSLTLGTGTGGLPVGADLRHDQWTLGWEEGYRSPEWSGFRFVPFAQGAVGVRTEGVMIQGQGPRTLAGQATVPVLRGAAGVRVVWTDTLSMGASLDGWLPGWREELRGGGEHVTLNDAGWALGLHLAAHVAW
jgi:hypothetical protein